MLLLLYIHTFWRPWFRVICIYDYIWIYLSYAIHPGGLELATFRDTTACPPKKKCSGKCPIISSKYERFAGSRRPVRSRSMYLTTMQIMDPTLKKSSKNIKKNNKTNLRCSHLKCEQLFFNFPPKTWRPYYMCLLEVSSSSSIIFFQTLHWISYGLPEEIWTHRPSPTTQPESWWSKRIERKTTPAWWRDWNTHF